MSAITNTLSRSIGAVAQLFDISELYHTPAFTTIQDIAYDIWSRSPNTDPLAISASKFGFIKQLGIHDFVNFNGNLSPKFDFTQYLGNPEDFVIAAKKGDIPAPTDPANNVDWLELTNVAGELAQQVFRVGTVAGKPPSTVSFLICDNNPQLTRAHVVYARIRSN